MTPSPHTHTQQLSGGLCDTDITYAEKPRSLRAGHLCTGEPESGRVCWQAPQAATEQMSRACVHALGTDNPTPEASVHPVHFLPGKDSSGRAVKPELLLRTKFAFVRGGRKNYSLSFLWMRGIMSLVSLVRDSKTEILISAQHTPVVRTD